MHNYATYCYNVLQRLISQINQVLQVSNTNIPSIYKDSCPQCPPYHHRSMFEIQLGSDICNIFLYPNIMQNAFSCCTQDLPNYIQRLFHLKKNSLSNTKTEKTLISIMFARKTLLHNVISRVDTGCFRHRYTDFGHTKLGLC